MGVQVCGAHDEDAARSLARNPFVSNFSGCLKVAKEDVKDTFESSEKRIEDNITVEPFIKDKALTFHHWVKTCFWLNTDPEQVPFPKENVDAILEQSGLHNQFLANASDNKMAVKPKPFTKDHKFDEWAKEFEECLTLLPRCTGLPSVHVICRKEEPTLFPTATKKENFVSMAQLSGGTFEIDSEKAHILLLPLLTKHSEALSVVKGTGGDAKCGRPEWLALVPCCVGFVMRSQELVQAEATLQDLHHSGEIEPHMWWAKFECKMKSAHSAIRQGSKTAADEQSKIQNLLGEIEDPSSDHVHSSIDRGALKEEILQKHPMPVTPMKTLAASGRQQPRSDRIKSTILMAMTSNSN